MSSPKRLARIAVLLYLMSHLWRLRIAYVTAKVYRTRRRSHTAVTSSERRTCPRGVIADLLQATVFVFLAMTLYVL